jgi:hypothetical protein
LPIAILIIIALPWIFFGVVWGFGGLQMNSHVAKVVTDNPHTTNYFVTFIGSIVSLLISILISMAVVRFARAWVIRNQESITLFRLSVLSGVKTHRSPWGFSDLGSLLVPKRLMYFFLVIGWMSIFTAVTPAITSLIAPIPFNKTDILLGTELDFASTATDCVNWFNTNTIPNSCDWKVICFIVT